MNAKKKLEVRVDIKPTRLVSATVHAPFDKALAELQKKDYEIIPLSINAELRIQQGEGAYISKKGNWVKEGVLYIPGEKNKLVRVSPILESAKEATQAHREEREFYPTREQIEQSLTDSVDFPEKTIGVNFPEKTRGIPTNRFDSERLTVYAFGGEKKAKVYGEFLNDVGIKEMPVLVVDNKDYVNKQSQPFVRQLWFKNLDLRSVLNGHWGLSLNYDCDIRGVKMAEFE